MIFLKSIRCNGMLFGPFNSFSQRRWKKPVVSAQTRLETRTKDLKLDKLVTCINKLKTILSIHQLMSQRKRGPFVSVQLMSRWRNIVGINVGMGAFLHKYPHVFELFEHPFRRNLCCKITRRMRSLIDEEEKVVEEYEPGLVQKIKKLLMMSRNGTLHVHALRLIRRELGLPEDFRDSILRRYSKDFRLVDLEIVELVDRNESLAKAEVEKWREKEYIDKWLSEFETSYAFPINFPTGFKIERGYREKLKNWQRLPYLKPYESKEVLKVRTCGGTERFEKRAVGIIHELLSLTVEKMLEVDRLAHFRKDFAIEVNVRELLLKHPGIFYICTKGSTRTVFLREAYSKGCLVMPNPVYVVRRKMLDLILLGCRNTRSMEDPEEIEEERGFRTNGGGRIDGDWVKSMTDVRVEEIKLFALRMTLVDNKTMLLCLCNIQSHSLKYMDPSLNGDGRVFENHNVLHRTARESNKEAWVQWMMPFGARTSPSRTTKLIGSKHYRFPIDLLGSITKKIGHGSTRLLLMTSIQSRK